VGTATRVTVLKLFQPNQIRSQFLRRPVGGRTADPAEADNDAAGVDDGAHLLPRLVGVTPFFKWLFFQTNTGTIADILARPRSTAGTRSAILV
jgi:hypothetical protein